MTKKKILMIGTGGTIASKITPNGLDPQLTSEEILAFIPGISAICEVDTLQICNIDSTNIAPDIWVLMTDTIREKYEQYDGFVVTHGTDTMAYTAAALSYMIQDSPKPIIITGAQNRSTWKSPIRRRISSTVSCTQRPIPPAVSKSSSTGRSSSEHGQGRRIPKASRLFPASIILIWRSSRMDA